jgi:SP family general alpha glucoside:H+ symporter-like MFS transporter
MAYDDMEAKAHDVQVEHAYDSDEKSRARDERAGAIEAENVELRMGVLAAVRAYPMATFWAFVVSSTIVSGNHMKR